jgi:hypothetical protein
MNDSDDSTCCIDSFKQLETYIPTDLILKISPTDYHQNNASLFKLARLVKDYEHAIGRTATPQELEHFFDRWSGPAREFWRSELTRDDYYAEFLECYSYARIGLDENPIELAIARAKAAPLPEVQGFTDERFRLLVAMCREMQNITGPDPFFLPTRKLGEMFHVPFSKAAGWLRALDVLEIIRLAPGEVRKSGGNRSPRYHYGPLTPNTVVTAPLPPPALPTLTDAIQLNDVETATPPIPEMLTSVTTRWGINVDYPFDGLGQTTGLSPCAKSKQKGGVK